MKNEAEALISIVNDITLAELYWDELPGVLRLLTVLRHDELAERMWESLSEEMKSFVIWSDAATRDAVVRQVVNDYLNAPLVGQQNQQNNN
jgi:hypothetical protein